ncbi:MAG: hypothetical protein AAFY41_00200 [Bacteroidota bacterium]
MNVAFGTLLILIFLSPGFVCRYAFLKGPYSRKNLQPSLPNEIFWSVIPAFFIQLLAIQFLKLVGFQPAIKELYLMVIGDPGVDFKIVNGELGAFLIYSAALLFLSYFLGASARLIVTHFNIDLKYNILKVNNEWYYLFSGKLAESEVDLIQLDVLVHSNSEKGTTLYSGILEDYFLNKEGGIDRLYMIKVYRDTKYEMPGDLFVIFGKDIININLTYFKLEEENQIAKQLLELK